MRMTPRQRIQAAVSHREMDRVPFDFFDEAGDLFINEKYTPCMRLSLTYLEQVKARIRFHQKFNTDLVFDVPVLIPSKVPNKVKLIYKEQQIFSPEPVLSSVSAMAWNSMPPQIAQIRELPQQGGIAKEIVWDNGIRSQEMIDLASGTTDVKIQAFRDLTQLLENIDCIDGDYANADFSYLNFTREQVGAEIILSGTIFDPCAALGWFVGLEKLMFGFYDQPDLAYAICEKLTNIAIRTGKEMTAHGIDIVRIGAATACLFSPDIYRKFCLPFQKKIVKDLHGAGALVNVHMCGALRHLLPLIPETCVDLLETISPAPLGDITLAQAKAAIGDRVCLKGNLSPIGALFNGTAAEAVNEAKQCIEVGRVGSGFIFSVADNLVSGTPHDNIHAVAEYLCCD
jgi:hypothetical protein